MRRLMLAVAAGASMVLGACGDDNGPGGKITLVADGEDDEIFTYTGVTGWQGLDAGTGSIDGAITVYSTSVGGTFPATVDAEIPDESAVAFYFDGTADSHYGPGTGGVFLLTGSSFGGTADCPNLPASIAPIVLVSCRFAIGTMAGSFDFTADRIDGTGPATHTQANTSYSLPAVQVSITLDYSDVALARRGR